MSGSKDIVNFDVIEDHKENIRSLPGGRSARKLAELFSPSPHHKYSDPSPPDTKNVNDCIRAEYETEIDNISESDDPLDVYDRYVRWTLDAYPSAQATPQSQLHILLERATKAFVNSSQYKSDPRYLKLWMYYIQFFSDSPRETYVFLSRHGIGETLAMFYEEYAAWLESVGKWSQAEEVYKLGIEREARPAQRLLRKFKEFEQRLAQQPDAAIEPSSPALPSVRPALAAKMDPFGAALPPTDSRVQQPSRVSGSVSGSSKPVKSKLAIFSENDAKPSAMSSRDYTSKGWDTIESLADRKKENIIEPKPWAGETLKAGGKKPTAAAKMAVFRDPSLAQIQNIVVVPSKHQVTIHPQTGNREYIHVNLAAIYPTPEEPGTELSFEEIIATNRGWLSQPLSEDVADKCVVAEPVTLDHEDGILNKGMKSMAIHREDVLFDENGTVRKQPKESRTSRKKKAIEVNETQIIKAKLDSPSRPKLRKKNVAEPTMTLHTRAATDDIYDIFNAPLKPTSQEEEESGDDDYESEDDYTTDGESVGTTRQAEPNEDGNDETADGKSVGEWSKCFDAGRETSDDEDDRICQRSQFPGVEEEEGQYTYDVLDEQDAQSSPPRTRTIFIPLPPEDYEPPTRRYRDPAEVANNRLPFMTPITERTECSLDVDMDRIDHFKTPSKQDKNSTPIPEESDSEPPSSPLGDILKNESPPKKMRVPLGPKVNSNTAQSLGDNKSIPHKRPIIKERQCSPVDEGIRSHILANIHPRLTTYDGFYDHHQEKYQRGNEIRRYARQLGRAGKSGSERASLGLSSVVIQFPDCDFKYNLKRELGAGAFAPVYLVENSVANDDSGEEENLDNRTNNVLPQKRRAVLEALKMESPPTPWEFYIMRLAHSRLGHQHRATASLSYAHEMHLYQDEAFLMLPFHPYGTLLDVVNFFRAEPSGVMDEQLAMFFTIELFRTIEALHAKSILHGDLKADNCLLRLDPFAGSASSEHLLANQWHADGSGGWETRGITLIDFGRGIDMKAFVPEVEFVADWKTSAQDCPEMKEGRPWTWQIDYYGLAGVIHCLLFGKYIEIVRADQGGLGRGGRMYRIRESLKRYWQTDMWSECFDVLLNPRSFAANEDGGKMPMLRSIKGIREKMQTWLAANSEKGVGLKSLIGKVEAVAKNRK